MLRSSRSFQGFLYLGQSQVMVSTQNKIRTLNEIQQEDEDRLTSLPDSLLITILSLLPLHSAAATSALSRRWRQLWTHITHLSLDFSRHRPFESAVTVINHIFSQLKSPKIHSFHLNLYLDISASKMLKSSGILVPWIHHICRRNPEVFKLNFGGITSISYEIPFCLFEAQSLVQLELRANLEFGFIHDNTRMLSFIKLPNLKKLTLELSDAHIPLMNGPLLKGCPLLQDLYLDLYLTENTDHTVDISTPNLKCFNLDVGADKLGNCKLVIDAPNLEEFYFRGVLTFYDFVNNPSNLQEAEISITEGLLDNNMSKISGLIQGICSVRSLVLQDSSIFLLDSIYRLYALPVFHNSIYLSFSYAMDPSGCINKLPRCFLSGNLKRVDVRDVFPDNVEFKMIKHILSNAVVLEKLRVYVSHNMMSFPEDQDQIEYEACKKLFIHSRNSVNCQIEFYGLDINASSKDFRDGVLIYQTLD